MMLRRSLTAPRYFVQTHQPMFEVIGHGAHLHLEIHLRQSPEVGATGAVVQHQAGNDVFDLWSEGWTRFSLLRPCYVWADKKRNKVKTLLRFG